MAKFTISDLQPEKEFPHWEKLEHIDHLHLFVNKDRFTSELVVTKNGPADIVKVDAIVCVDCCELWGSQWVFGKRLVERLAGSDPGVVPGRLGQGHGQYKPWLLDDATTGDRKEAQDFLDRFADTLPTGEVVFDEVSMQAARDPSAQEQF
jgi:hypothetical protein